MAYTESQIQTEAERLYKSLKHVARTMNDCLDFAPLTLKINELKKAQNAIILAHSYQKPEIIFGVADEVGDSFALSVKATETDADIIIFSSVRFMGETAKILNPDKKVHMPKAAGCSLAESITAEDVRKMKKKYPGRPVACYVNTTAEVKAECDVCVTSANVIKIIKAMPEDEIIFLPDKYMARNVAKMTGKKLIPWDGVCIVHEAFDFDNIKRVREKKPDAKILAHTECPEAIIELADMAGGTSDMENYVRTSKAKEFMLITECGLSDRFRVEFLDKQFVGTCQMCPYMKESSLEDILQVLKNPQKEQIINLDSDVMDQARKSLKKMITLSQG